MKIKDRISESIKEKYIYQSIQEELRRFGLVIRKHSVKELAEEKSRGIPIAIIASIIAGLFVLIAVFLELSFHDIDKDIERVTEKIDKDIERVTEKIDKDIERVTEKIDKMLTSQTKMQVEIDELQKSVRKIGIKLNGLDGQTY